MSAPHRTPYFLARSSRAPRAGVIVMMEGNGMGWQLMRVCERLAGEGYLAIAPEVYHREADGHGSWEDAIKRLRPEQALADISDCASILREQGVARIGITGFCMGGRLSYLAAVSEIHLQAAAPFYGGGIDKILGQPRCPLLAFFGGRDEWVPTASIEAVRAHHPNDVVVYPEAGHGFMRDGSESWHEPSARDAWARLLGFFGEHLGP